MNRQSHWKGALCAVLSAATALAGSVNVCQLTSQDGLRSCVRAAQGDYWTAIGMCANISQLERRQACSETAKADYQSAIASCHDQFTAREQVCQKLGGCRYDPLIDPTNFTTNIDNP